MGAIIQQEQTMKTVKQIQSHVEELIDENWLWFDPEPNNEDETIIRITPDNIEEAAKFYEVPAPFLEMLDDAIRTMANEIIAELHLDLEDVWEKVNGK
jgi:hypothetical protein